MAAVSRYKRAHSVGLAIGALMSAYQVSPEFKALVNSNHKLNFIEEYRLLGCYAVCLL
jgi:hypothetical protein